VVTVTLPIWPAATRRAVGGGDARRIAAGGVGARIAADQAPGDRAANGTRARIVHAVHERRIALGELEAHALGGALGLGGGGGDGGGRDGAGDDGDSDAAENGRAV
jgi:hypothetical protein